MLETAEERIKILKKGFTQRQIEKMYIEGNDLKIVSLPILVEIIEMEEGQNKKICETSVESAQSLSLAVASIFNASQYKTFSPMIQHTEV